MPLRFPRRGFIPEVSTSPPLRRLVLIMGYEKFLERVVFANQEKRQRRFEQEKRKRHAGFGSNNHT